MSRWTFLTGMLLAAMLTLPAPARAGRDSSIAEDPTEAHHPHPIVPSGRPASGDRPVAYVIVTDAAFADAFQELAECHSDRGLPATVRTTQWIRDSYPLGRDLPESIRMFLQDAHRHWQTRFALMGGDEPFVPIRRAHLFVFFDPEVPPFREVPTDAYYACLDGDWNADGDSLWGEFPTFFEPQGDSADLIPELAVGRAPVQSEREARRFVAHARDAAEHDAEEGPIRALFTASAFRFPGLLEIESEQVRSTLDSIATNRTTRLYAQSADYPGSEALDRSRLNRALERGPDLAVLVQGGDPGRLQLQSFEQFWTSLDAAALQGRRAHLVVSFANDFNRPGMNSIGRALEVNEHGGADVVLAPSDLIFLSTSARAFQALLRSMLALGSPTIGEAWNEAFVRHGVESGTGGRDLLALVLFGDPASPSLGSRHEHKHGHDAMAGVTAPAGPDPGSATLFAKSAAIVTFELPDGPESVWLRTEVLDVSGRRVRDLEQSLVRSGTHAVAWDLRDDQGNRVPRGLYFVRMNAGTTHRVRRVVVD